MIRNRVAKTARHSSPPQLFLFSTLFRPKTYKIYFFFFDKVACFQRSKRKEVEGVEGRERKKASFRFGQKHLFQRAIGWLKSKGLRFEHTHTQTQKKRVFLQRKSFYIRFFSFLQNRKFEKRLFEVASEVSSVRDEGNKIKKIFFLL